MPEDTKLENRRAAQAANRDIGARIRLFRIRGKISQEALANQLGVTFQQVQKYESGRNRLSAGGLIVVANALGSTIGDLLGDNNLDRKTRYSDRMLHALHDPGIAKLIVALGDLHPDKRDAVTVASLGMIRALSK